MLPENVDVLIVGAGTAGAACAWHAARHGLSVLCLDAGPFDRAGARWVNGISARLFDEADIPAPEGEELRGGNGPFNMFLGFSDQRIRVTGHRHLEVDMRHLVARLQEGAREAGATLVNGVRVRAIEGRQAQTDAGHVVADVVVDASGMSGLNLLGAPKVRPRDICAAAQWVCRVRDRDRALAFLDRYGCTEHETLCFSGVEGGYSILNVQVEGDEVALLSGSIPGEGHRSGQKLIDDFVASSGFVGEPIFGGKRPIPLGRPLVALARGQHAAIGDAGRQVFAAHGSGIGAGMTAGRMLAEAVAHGGGPEAYNVAWQRTHGGLFAAYDVFRRFSQRLDLDDLGRLFRAGVLDSTGVAAGLTQQFPAPDPSLVARIGPAIARAGRPGVELAKTGVKMGLLRALYSTYPEAGSRHAWSSRVARVARDHKWDA
jgi:flavin-dependent dehydrogenase